MGIDHATCGQRFDQLERDVQTMNMDIRQSLPSNTENNPQREGKEQSNTIALQSGKALKPLITHIHEKEEEQVEHHEPIEEVVGPVSDLVMSNLSTTNVPFLTRLEDKKKTDENEQIDINASCRALIAKKIPLKLKDLSSFTISIEIGDIYFSKALCDLRANINLMPLSIHQKLRLEDIKITSITLQLANRFLVRGIIIPVDFVVLNFKEDREIPIMWGRPILAISKSTIDLE
ncbi:gag-asp_proteas domain-containing protein [Gossypium australe]|uniref:Gag-asp_proteas domain-containing protein n=1 Tax=Gossypium australe TaxID=47621 RepID=A0A5B6WVP2_9ROSI|nr:gag-asp_proteas domain-containing protein [Gossypium australe]